ncbi:hypothetical protein GCM10009839_26630 [Catenulispora yoronensis]|uniref:Peptidase M50 domain-containing protein n=1 Tax=Catenulispora yoronensis TaxID=450799 RepID=A0ABN2U1R2_9ACTN
MSSVIGGTGSGRMVVVGATTGLARVKIAVGVVAQVVWFTVLLLREVTPVREHRGDGIFLVFVGGCVAAILITAVVHEVGHAVAALLMGLPIAHFSVVNVRRSKGGAPPHVGVRPRNVDAVTLPVRMAVVVAGGPVAGLVQGAVFLALADAPGRSARWHFLLLLPMANGVIAGVGNLIPGGVYRGFLDDGSQLVRWLTRPAEMRARLRGGGPRPEPGPRPGVDQAAGLEASKEAWRRINKVIAERLQGKLPDPEELAGISALAEFGYARVPSVLFARSTLALVRVMQERAVEARALLVGTELEPAGGAHQEIAFAVRAMAEASLNDAAQGRRLIESARRVGGAEQQPLVRLAELFVEACDRAMKRAAEAAAVAAEAAAAGTPGAGTPEAGTPEAAEPRAAPPEAGTPQADTTEANGPEAAAPGAAATES